MKTKLIVDRFTEAVRSLYGAVKETKAGRDRANESLKAHGDTFNGAMTAAFARQMRHNIRAGYHKNTRGLPFGTSVHEVKAARELENYLACRDPNDETVIGDTRINAADGVLERVKANNIMRAKTARRRGSKLARRAMPHSRARAKTMNLKEFCAAHTAHLRENVTNGRIPYTRPLA